MIAFSTESVYALAERIRGLRGGCAVGAGGAEPAHPECTGRSSIRLAKWDSLVATDAIGMGLNLDLDHVAFSA